MSIDGTINSHRSLHSSTKSQGHYGDLRKHEIRLIDLYPGRLDNPLICGLRNVLLTEKPQYESLSYCWGLNKPEVELKCNDRSILVTKNLASALRHLRHVEETRTLWIDAVCINQQNVEERGQQVALMKNIFQRSQRTLVWLGDDSRDSHRAIELVRHLAKAWQQRRRTKRFWWSQGSIKIPPLYDTAWRAFALLLQRPWFRRAWVIQEASVANDVLVACGTDLITWDELIFSVQYAIDLGVFLAHGGSTTYHALQL